MGGLLGIVGLFLFGGSVLAFFVSVIMLIASIFDKKLVKTALKIMLGSAIGLVASITLCSTVGAF